MLLAEAPRRVNISAAPLRVLGASRVRDGPQWNERLTALEVCERAEWCDHELVERDLFFSEVQKYSFVLCPHGGGIDPNPKLFTAILAGAIPIIREDSRYPAIASMYEGWPVVRVARWADVNLTSLAKWKEQHAPAYEDTERRNEVLHRLTMKYWWGKVTSWAERTRGYEP